MSRKALRISLPVLGIILVAANLRAALTTVGPVLSDIQDDLRLTSSAASYLVSLPLLGFAVISPVAPLLARRFGLERIVAIALAVLATGLLLRSTPPDALLWLGTALIGMAIAVLNVVLPAWVKRDFPTSIGQVTGTYAAVQSGVAAIASGVAVPVAGLSALGWRLPLGMWAGLALIALGVLLPMLRKRPAPTAGTAPSATGTTARTATDTRNVHPRQDAAPTPRPLWRSALTWQVTGFMGLQSTHFYVLVTWLSTIERDAGISDIAAGTHMFLVNAFGIVGSLVCSALIARHRDQRFIGAILPLFLLASSLGLLLAPEAAALWAILAGLGGGASITLSLSLFGLRTRHHTAAASLSGLAQSIGYVLAAVGPVAVGALHDATGSWSPALVSLVVIDVILIGAGYLAGRDRTVD